MASSGLMAFCQPQLKCVTFLKHNTMIISNISVMPESELNGLIKKRPGVVDFSISCECTKSYLAPSKQRELKKEKKPKRNKTSDLVEEVQKSRERYFSERRSKATGYLVPLRPGRGALGIKARHAGCVCHPNNKNLYYNI